MYGYIVLISMFATLELTAAHATHRFTINMDRSLVEGAGGDYRAIRDFVATNLK